MSLNPHEPVVAASLRQAMLLHQQGDLAAAIARYQSVITQAPLSADAMHLLGLALHQSGDSSSGIAWIEKAICQRPNQALFQSNLAQIYYEIGHRGQAIQHWQRALALDPSNTNLARRCAQALLQRGQKAAAKRLLGKSILANKASGARATLLLTLAEWQFNDRQPRKAISAASLCLREDPDNLRAQWMLIMLRRTICDWEDDTAERPAISASLRAAIIEGRLLPDPFSLMSLSDDPALLHTATHHWIQRHAPAVEIKIPPLPKAGAKDAENKILHIGYLASELRAHPMGYLCAGLFAAHNRARFRISVFHYGAGDDSNYHRRIRSNVSHWYDIRGLSDHQAAAFIRRQEVDILVDLKGLTLAARPGIVAARAAPLQINWLAYPGSMAADYVDYILADRIVLTEFLEKYFSEQVIRLPHSYQINDDQREISNAAEGRPDAGFLFCCFNTLHKISPSALQIWLKLLQQVPNSKFWLLEGHRDAIRNLQRHAQRAGIDPERLIFAPPVAHADHLARLRQADLVLDSWPYGAHTTASDALWAGVPLLTIAGNSFASRVAASLLQAQGLDILIAADHDAYERLALSLAQNPVHLAEIRAQVNHAKSSGHLFKTAETVQALETAFSRIWARHCQGLAPAGFSLEGSDKPG